VGGAAERRLAGRRAPPPTDEEPVGARLDCAARDTVSRLVLVYVALLVIPTADLFHVVVPFTELMYVVSLDEAALLPGLTEFVLPVLAGNTVGGVLLVTVGNYVRTTERPWRPPARTASSAC